MDTITDGVWTVGVDIEPGTYRTTDVSSDCYWDIYVTGTTKPTSSRTGSPAAATRQSR